MTHPEPDLAHMLGPQPEMWTIDLCLDKTRLNGKCIDDP